MLPSKPLPPPVPNPRFTAPASFYGMNVYYKFYIQLICVFVLVVLASLRVDGQSTNSAECVTNFDPNTDYFPVKATVETATLFSIQYFKFYKLVTNKFTNETFALYQCGTQVPPATAIPAGTKVFEVPVKKMAVLGTSSVAYLDMLGLRSKISIIDSSDFISSPCVQLLRDNGSITALSPVAANAATQLSTVSLVIGASTADTTKQTSVSTSAEQDPGSLNRAEWINFYSTFFNVEDRAIGIFKGIVSNYACFRQLAVVDTTKPVLAWVVYDAPSDFNNNTASWSIADAQYKKQLTEAAGAVYFNTSQLKYTTSSDFLTAIASVDIIIDETFIASDISDVYRNYGLTPDAPYKFVKNKKIFREDGITSPTDGRDWFERAVPMQDAVLEDLINVVNEKLPKSGYQRKWFRNVALGETKTISASANCTDPNAATTVCNLNYGGRCCRPRLRTLTEQKASTRLKKKYFENQIVEYLSAVILTT
ncbi:8636_t:CDS:2 [Paraglomus brasilianum]|uniref:8636_t:CDS:1 n=1 Tax=Paraglomus brasilianum TaxID=144538 RepID=A0A9N9G3Z2_9GLOM|nr:8636_t:CDS:2 [Paraglomus brasilianum]